MEDQITRPEASPHWNLVFNPLEITLDVLNYNYKGTGLATDPYIVEFIPGDWRNPVSFALWKKWLITITLAFGTLAVTFTSSSYSGGIVEILTEFDINAELSTLGISLFVLGFAVGPLLWAPLSELYGRQIVFFCTFTALTFFNAGAAASQNIYTLLILRFFAGSFGSSVLTNAGGVIADMFPASERGLATSVFAAAPFLGPSIGPLVGGFVAQSVGWRWVEGVSAIFTGVLWIVGTIIIPETYSPVILHRRAQKLSRMTGKTYKSAVEIEQGTKTTSQAFRTALVRPWVLLFTEPIVLLLSIYVAIIYGTLYMMFGAFPIVYQRVRSWSEGIGGLSFLGVAIGIIIAVILTIPDNNRYNRAASRCNGSAPPEARLPPAILGSIFIPVGLFWFAWTNGPDVHWSVAIIGTAFFGFGMVLVFLSIINYLVDAYVIYAASVLAANSVLRSLFGAIFPLFTTYMYNGLGIHWASSIPAFLALSCVPFPFLFYRYGAYIRSRCKFATHAAKILEEIRAANFSSDRDAISPTRIRDESLEAQDEK